MNDIKYLHTDSRSVFDPKKSLFVALKTGVADGHAYVSELYAKGVRNFLVNKNFDTSPYLDGIFTTSDNTLLGLKNLASNKLFSNTALKVVITGSAGKTTVKEMLYTHLLSEGINVVRSPRSWNSQIGVSAGLWETSSLNSDVILTEVGIDGPGQSDFYSDFLIPDIGIITSITSLHDNAFPNGKEGNIREIVNVVRKAKIIIFNSTDPSVKRIISEMAPDAKVIPSKGIDELAESAFKEINLSLERKIPETSIDFKGVLERTNTRIDVERIDDLSVLIKDNFTNDLRSLRDALDFMRRRFTPERTNTVILSDFFHSPALSSSEITKIYEEAGDMMRKFGVNKILCYGTECTQYFNFLELNSDCRVFPSCNELLKEIKLSDFSRQLILLKVTDRKESDIIAKSFEATRHDTTLDIDLDALTHNYNFYRKLLPSGNGIIAMVKASAYGLGDVEIAKTLQDAGASYLAVAVVDEGVKLRRQGITMPIIILNPITNKYDSLFAEKLDPAVFSIEELDRLEMESKRHNVHEVNVHLKLDTGMHRLGFVEKDLPLLIERLRASSIIKVKSIFSHLATADCPDLESYTQSQIGSFERMSLKIINSLPKGDKIKRHLLNTAGIEKYGKSKASYDMGRLGIGLYGISPIPGSNAQLKPVATLQTTIISLKEWPEGTPIGYGCRGVTSRPSRIATIPIGYADGLNRHFGRGNLDVIVNGTACPIIGNVCMDLCMIDVTNVNGVKVGDKVEIFGQNNPVELLAEKLDTIPYEILTSVSPRVHRRYLKR